MAKAVHVPSVTYWRIETGQSDPVVYTAMHMVNRLSRWKLTEEQEGLLLAIKEGLRK